MASPSKPPPSSRPSRGGLVLARFGLRALRVTASTVAVVALVQEQWVPGVSFGVAWLLLLKAPSVFRFLKDDTTTRG
jgi:hypothetical protein